jgi:uncharacterized protein
MQLPQDKYHILQLCLKALGRVGIAFSGGVDSTFLLKAAVDTLGANNVLTCIGVSASLSGHQLGQAREMAKLIGAELVELPLDELDDPNYQANKADRCFHCKTCQFRSIRDYAAKHGFAHTVCGSNWDDKDDYRPGNRAMEALGIGAPLMEAKLTKHDIRLLSRQLGLPTADVPASPCLASRVAYGEPITEDKLKQVEQAEEFLRELGFVEFRVRHHGDLARIEVPASQIQQITQPEFRDKILPRFKELGFHYISVDIQGFRSGSLNESLDDTSKF